MLSVCRSFLRNYLYFCFLCFWRFYSSSAEPSEDLFLLLVVFTSSSKTFVDLSYHALLCVDAMKAFQRLVALNALGCSLI